MKIKILTALLRFTVKHNAEMGMAREVNGVKRRNNVCGAWWDDLVDTESYIRENGKIVGGVGRCEEQLLHAQQDRRHRQGEDETKGLGTCAAWSLQNFSLNGFSLFVCLFVFLTGN